VEESQVDRARDLNQIDAKIRETVSALARTTAELEKERGHRRRSEQRVTSLAAQLQALHQELSFHLGSEQENQKRIAVIEKDLLEREEALAQARAEFEKQTADRQLAEDQLRVAGDLSERLESNLALFEEAKKTFKRAQEEMGARLEASLSAWKESQSKLQKEVSERQQLEEALLAVRRELQEQAKVNTLESSKVDAARQLEDLERKRSEGDVLRSYYLAMDSARQSQALLNNLRRQVGESLQDLRQAAGQLLQADLREEQRKMAENVLENALFLQTSLQQASGLNLAGPAPVETRSAAGDLSLTSRLVEIPQRGQAEVNTTNITGRHE
jgi:hypothetical protein